MQIHFTDPIPFNCARNLDDKRLNKQLTETGQILSTALHNLDLYNPNLFKPFSPNHSVVKWVGKRQKNFFWTKEYFWRLCKEYQHRKGEKQASERLLPIIHEAYDEVKEHFGYKNHDGDFHEIEPINFAKRKSLDLDFTDMDNTYKAYRKYMIERWKLDDDPTWTNRDKPDWATTA